MTELEKKIEVIKNAMYRNSNRKCILESGDVGVNCCEHPDCTSCVEYFMDGFFSDLKCSKFLDNIKYEKSTNQTSKYRHLIGQEIGAYSVRDIDICCPSLPLAKAIADKLGIPNSNIRNRVGTLITSISGDLFLEVKEHTAFVLRFVFDLEEL